MSLPESWSDKSSKSAVLYSSGSKLLLELPVRSLYLSSLILPEITNFSIQVHSVRKFIASYRSHLNHNVVFQEQLSSSSCTFELTGSSGTIKSPLYPNSYPHLSDCRWKIVTPAGTKIRLLFALFETQEERDYVFVKTLLKLKLNQRA